MKIKLLIFQYSLANWGGAENIIWKVCQYLQQTELYEINVVGMVDEQPSFEKEMTRIGITTYCLRVSDKKSILLQIPRLLRLATIIRHFRPDIMFNVLFPSILAGGIIGKLCGVKHIIGNIHGPALFKKKIAILLDRLVSPLYEGYITVAPHIKERFRTREKIPADKITVIPNGLELRKVPEGYDRNKFRTQWGLSPNDIVIGTIGRVYPEKNQKYLVAIGKELIKKMPTVKLLLVGDGPRFAELKTNIRELGMQEHCVLPGWQTETTAFLKCMDLFVLPSHYEGMPGSILEAWQQKVPVAGTAVPGIKDLVTDGQTGRLLPKDNAQAAAEIIATLFADWSKAQRMAENGFTEWQHRYTVEKMAEEHHLYFQKLVLGRYKGL